MYWPPSPAQIALLLLDSASSKAAVQLPANDLTLAPGTSVVAVGFGTTSEGSAVLSGERGRRFVTMGV